MLMISYWLVFPVTWKGPKIRRVFGIGGTLLRHE